jgi:hypothetical protein
VDEGVAGVSKGTRLIPYTNTVAAQAYARVLEVVLERGLIEGGDSDEETAEQLMQVCEAQGLVKEGDIPVGSFVLLPGRGLALLFVTPWSAEEYGPDLQRRPSPIMFDSTDAGQIILPARALLAKLEAVANNRAASPPTRALALNLSRRAIARDLVLPSEVETVALEVTERDGTTTTIEALPPGMVVSLDAVTT